VIAAPPTGPNSLPKNEIRSGSARNSFDGRDHPHRRWPSGAEPVDLGQHRVERGPEAVPDAPETVELVGAAARSGYRRIERGAEVVPADRDHDDVRARDIGSDPGIRLHL
jgi:hypothetical protein